MRRIMFAIGNRAHYARVKPIIKKIDKCNYMLLIYDTACDSIRDILEADGYTCNCVFLDTHISGSNLVTMTKSTGKAIMLIADVLEEYKPDIMVVIADRYEIMAPAIASRYMNICLAHIQGGEITGTVDDSIRHTVSKLANYHFVSNTYAKNNLLKMGEKEDSIYITGCPTLDVIKNNSNLIINNAKSFWNIKRISDIPKYILVNFHPVTTEYNQNSNYVNELYKAIKNFDYNVIWLMPNPDAGSNKIDYEIEKIKSKNKNFFFIRNLEITKYLAILKYAQCIIGNSSVGIREASYLGTPSVSIGSRQRNRVIAENVIRCDMNAENIRNSIIRQLKHGKYTCSKLYGDGQASEKIAYILQNMNIKKEKFFDGGTNGK